MSALMDDILETERILEALMDKELMKTQEEEKLQRHNTPQQIIASSQQAPSSPRDTPTIRAARRSSNFPEPTSSGSDDSDDSDDEEDTPKHTASNPINLPPNDPNTSTETKSNSFKSPRTINLKSSLQQQKQLADSARVDITTFSPYVMDDEDVAMDSPKKQPSDSEDSTGDSTSSEEDEDLPESLAYSNQSLRQPIRYKPEESSITTTTSSPLASSPEVSSSKSLTQSREDPTEVVVKDPTVVSGSPKVLSRSPKVTPAPKNDATPTSATGEASSPPTDRGFKPIPKISVSNLKDSQSGSSLKFDTTATPGSPGTPGTPGTPSRKNLHKRSEHKDVSSVLDQKSAPGPRLQTAKRTNNRAGIKKPTRGKPLAHKLQTKDETTDAPPKTIIEPVVSPRPLPKVIPNIIQNQPLKKSESTSTIQVQETTDQPVADKPRRPMGGVPVMPNLAMEAMAVKLKKAPVNANRSVGSPSVPAPNATTGSPVPGPGSLKSTGAKKVPPPVAPRNKDGATLTKAEAAAISVKIQAQNKEDAKSEASSDANPEPTKVEPTKVEPAKAEPAKPEPTKPDKADLGKQGYLLKRGGLFNAWRKRWFVLKDKQIAYYKTSQAPNPQGIIRLVNSVEKATKKDVGKDFAFIIRSTKPFLCAAPTENEMEEWVQILTELNSKSL